MTANQPTVEERLSRLETLFVNVGEKVAEHDGNIDVLVANTQQLTENVAAVSQRVDELNEQTTRNINRLAEEAAQDRQQAAIERQEFRNQMEQRQREIQQIWEYLRNRNGGSLNCLNVSAFKNGEEFFSSFDISPKDPNTAFTSLKESFEAS